MSLADVTIMVSDGSLGGTLVDWSKPVQSVKYYDFGAVPKSKPRVSVVEGDPYPGTCYACARQNVPVVKTSSGVPLCGRCFKEVVEEG